MPSKTYSEEFRRDAVGLYESSPGVSINAIAAELGVNRNTLQIWVRKYGTGTESVPQTPTSVTDAERIRQLERENARLKEERDILRKAAKYFAEETNW